MKRLLPLSLLVAACGGVVAPDAPSETKNTPSTNAEYPSGPYGYVTGTVVDNLQMVGRIDDDANLTPTNDPIRLIKLSDYYQKRDKVKVLVVMVAAEWCGPCRAEQAGVIEMYNQYKEANMGVEFLEAIVQDKNYKPADMATADRWANSKWIEAYPYTTTGKGAIIPFPITADPTVALGPYYDVAAFPMQFIIRTSDMQIMWQNNGLANAALQNQIDAVLENP
jgi:thiol-disulfide isomerase/thioredoxin